MIKFKELLFIPLIFLLVWIGLKWYRIPGQVNGAVAPDFTGYLANEDSLKLSDFKGQLVFLDFWGSWCAPCRSFNRDLTQIFDKYKNSRFTNESKFNIISVGIETNKTHWLSAIEKDGLVWESHISDLNRLYDHVALLYGVREIPNSFLIDGDGQIIGVNLLIEELDEILAQRSQK